MRLEFQEGMFLYQAHEGLANVWELLQHHSNSIDQSVYTVEEKLLFKENYQR